MADTGAPWNIPYVEPTDLVRDYPAADEAQALAVAAGLTAAGGLVAVKYAIKTGVQSNSLASGAATEITGLTLTHSLADDANDVLFFGTINGAGTDFRQDFSVAANFNGTQTPIGDAADTRISITSQNNQPGSNEMSSVSFMVKYSPGTTASRTYGVDVVNVSDLTVTRYVNRSENDTDRRFIARAVSSVVLMEVKV